MPDKYLKFVNSGLGKKIARSAGLPQPVLLDRYVAGQPFLTGPTLVGGASGSMFMSFIDHLVAQQSIQVLKSGGADESVKLKTVIFDASGISNAAQTAELHSFFSSIIKRLGKCARLVVVGLIPEQCAPSQHVAQRSLLGFVKALAKEMRLGSSVNLIWAQPHSGESLTSTLTFLASDRSAYVSGQYLKVYQAKVQPTDFGQSLLGRNVLVTGAARGIGKAIAQVMHSRGAAVNLLDIPKMETELKALSAELNGDWLTTDITAADAGGRIAAHFGEKSLDVLVHNAGITRDKKLVNMKAEMWNQVMDTNLSCQERINQHLIEKGVLRAGCRLVLVSSISGIGGNAGQTNYSSSKAGVIGMVEAYSRPYFDQGITINAVAPGFIETDMIATIPFAMRQAGRRLNSMAQGGLPEDVAEAVAMFAQVDSQGVYGNVLRVCGQALMGS